MLVTRCGIVLTLALAALAFNAPREAAAQNTGSIGNPAGMAPNTPGVYEAHPEAKQGNSADQLFAREALIAGQAEVQAGKLAGRKGQSPAVKDFANRMVKDHSSAGERLNTLLKGGAYSVSTQLDTDHRVMMDQLNKANGKGFDELYIRGQIVDHQKAAQLYEWIIDNGQDTRLQSYAMDVLPVVMMHLEMAKGALAQLTGSAP
jgi:putative membrane protein